MSFSHIVSGEMTTNNNDRLKLDRKIQHASVRCEKVRLHSEQAELGGGLSLGLMRGKHRLLGAACHIGPNPKHIAFLPRHEMHYYRR